MTRKALFLFLAFATTTAHTPTAIECSVKTQTYCPSDVGILLVKRWEGFRKEPYWDVNTYRIGWGSPSTLKQIDAQQADTELRKTYYALQAKLLNKYPLLDFWEIAILTSMAYNVGNFGPALDTQLRAGDTRNAACTALKYIKSGGEPVKGLMNRRWQEYQLLTSGPQERYRIAETLQKLVKKQNL